MTLGSALAALDLSVATTVVGTVLIGVVLAPLGTYYSLILDTLAPPQQTSRKCSPCCAPPTQPASSLPVPC